MITFKTYLTEKKDHLIDQLHNLTPEQKVEIKAFFVRKPNLENKIDWRRKDLTYDTFKTLMHATKTEKKRLVRKHGIAGLKEGEDFIELHTYDDFPFQAYIPLSWEASKLIASNKIGGIEGKWCTAYQKEKKPWNDYASKKIILIYLVGGNSKWALVIDKNDKLDKIVSQDDITLNYAHTNQYIDGMSDTRLYAKFPRMKKDPNVFYFEDVLLDNNRNKIAEARELIQFTAPETWFERGIREKIIRAHHYDVSHGINDFVQWHHGFWESGNWADGIWEDGVWEDGSWENGVWRGGVWNKGVWCYGDWLNGIWQDGTWENGVWRRGVWNNGTWEEGQWMGGTWNNGTWVYGVWEGGIFKGGRWMDGVWGGGKWLAPDTSWEGGYDENNIYHPKGDSPNKWKK